MTRTLDSSREGVSAAPLPFSVLLREEPVDRGGMVWVARSVFTSHVGCGDDRDEALDNLARSLELSIVAAGDLGLSTHDWYERQQPERPEVVEAFRAAVAVGGSRPDQLAGERLTMPAQVARAVA